MELKYAVMFRKPIIFLHIDNSPVQLRALSDYTMIEYAGREKEALNELFELLKGETHSSKDYENPWNSAYNGLRSYEAMNKYLLGDHESSGNSSQPIIAATYSPEEEGGQIIETELSSESKKPEPYNGDNMYVFLSYSHKDAEAAIDIVHHLQAEGFRVWYDEGIDPGSEWDENIASHVEKCGYFIALLSLSYLGSSNCKDELNYARELEKPRLLIYLDNVQLPGGMRMRLNRLQAIHRYKYSEQKAFYKKLFAAKGISVCRNPDYS